MHHCYWSTDGSFCVGLVVQEKHIWPRNCQSTSYSGPRLFLYCPMDIAGSQVWFTDLWNYSIIPCLLEAVREGLQMYGKRAPWEDPADWVIETYPWSNNSNRDWPSLLRLRPEDMGFDT
ncbi:neuron navigator 2-like [Liolophura sinensis]|uniref:neuron navigator 2-like n=1 Tax=Liolophura sinensis TaxID=3198878 RepID=UPI0031592C88